MFDKNITQVNQSTKIIKNNPEDIKLNISKKDVDSFFIEAERDSFQYKCFLQRNPIFYETLFHNYTERELNDGYLNYYDKLRREMEGGYYYDKKNPCTVLNIQYIGKNKFLFEIKLTD